MDPLIVQKSRRRLLLPLVGFLAVVGGSVFVLMTRGPSGIVWSSIVIFGGGALFMFVQFFDNQPRLVVSDDGICDPNWRIGTIPWSDLCDANIRRSQSGKDFLCLSLLNPEVYRSRLGGSGRIMNSATRATGFGDFALDVSALGLDAQVLFKLVADKLAQTKASASEKKMRN